MVVCIRHFIMDVTFTWLLCMLLVLELPGDVEGLRKNAKEVDKANVSSNCFTVQRNSAEYLHFLMLSDLDDAMQGTEYLTSGKTHVIQKRKQSQPLKTTSGVGHSSKAVGLSEMVVGFQSPQEQDIADKCIKTPPCDEKAKYRTINGVCNNLKFPMWGVAGSALVRLLPAHYQDGISKIRKSKSGKELPNVRQLSTLLFPDKTAIDDLNMLNVMQWGQLVAHDTSRIAVQDAGVDCCTAKPSSCPASCLPIQIPKNDQFYSKFKVTCMNMVRSVTTDNLGCKLSPHQQIASVTHFVDASFIYGNNDSLAKSLRTLSDGKLKVQVTSDKREFPPNTKNPEKDCDNRENENVCYATGDIRANQNLQMTVLHVILLREHNRLCTVLKKLNPHWDDEKLYQEARRILVAEVQRITYDAYLPIILGEKFVKKLKLKDGKGDEPLSDDYDINLNPSTVNEFTTAAYRSFHSMIPQEVILYDKNFKSEKTLKLDDFYFRPSIIQEPGMLDKLLRGLAAQPAQSRDIYFSVAVTNFLFKSRKPYGKDLECIDMQRGRDHGLPTYKEVRSACGLKPVNKFEDLKDLLPQEAIIVLTSKYEDVNDIDMFVGGMLEKKVPGSLVGPTFQCIIGEQFKRWRNGDRYYYDFNNQPGSFNLDQVKQIRKVTLAEIFCRNGDNIEKLQRDVFRAPSDKNPIESCKLIMKMDLTPWKEK